MAVYTDVAAEDLALFLAGYDIGELLSYKGIAEGVENSNFLLHTSARLFHPDALREAGGRADLPFFLGADGASGQPRHHLPAAGARPRGRDAWAGSRGGRRRSSPSSGHVGPPTERAALRRRGRGAGAACISPARASR